MKTKTFKHELLNGGKETEIYYPVKDGEIESQFEEIFKNENYGFEKKKDGIYLDLGANIGMASLYFSNWAKKIYAFEPNPEIYEALVKNTKHLKNIETFNMAWSTANGKDFMYSGVDGDLPQTLFERSKKPEKRAILVDCITPNTFFEKHNINHIDIMKIDVEESEYIIFPSDQFKKVADKIDTIIGEAHFSASGGFPEIIPEILADYGFKTTFPKLKKPNYSKFFIFNDLRNGMEKRYYFNCETIFVAKRS